MARRTALPELPAIDPHEKALIDGREPRGQRLLAVGMLIFSLAFCALVFQAGWKEVLAYEKCAPNRAANCRAIAANPGSAH
jgi:hypothetical protein